jgi:hypothetical protein
MVRPPTGSMLMGDFKAMEDVVQAKVANKLPSAKKSSTPPPKPPPKPPSKLPPTTTTATTRNKLSSATAAGRVFVRTSTLPPASLYPVNKPAIAGNIDPLTTSQQHFPHWPFGAGAAVFAAFLFVLGMQLLNRGVRPTHQRRKTNRKQEENGGEARRGNWCCGIFFLSMSFMAQAVALTMAALSLVQPMASLSIVLNALAVPTCFPTESKTLKETGWIAIRGIVIVVIGNILIVIAAAKMNTAYAAEELESLFLQIDFILFELLCVIVGSVIFYFARNASARYHGSRGPFMLFYAYTAGWAGAQQYMFLKAVGECIKSGIHGRQGAAMFSPTPVIMCICCLVLAAIQLWLIVHGLSRFRNETVRFIGCYQGCVVCIGAATGGFYFNEFDQFTQFQWVCFTTGVGLIVWGVLIMSTLRGKDLDDHLQKNRLHDGGRLQSGNKGGLCSKLYCYHVCGPCYELCGSEESGRHRNKGLTSSVPDDYFDPMEHAHFAQLWADPDIW